MLAEKATPNSDECCPRHLAHDLYEAVNTLFSDLEVQYGRLAVKFYLVEAEGDCVILLAV